jgi:hypothetical protein
MEYKSVHYCIKVMPKNILSHFLVFDNVAWHRFEVTKYACSVILVTHVVDHYNNLLLYVFMFLCFYVFMSGQKVIDLEKWLTSPLVCPRIRMRHACPSPRLPFPIRVNSSGGGAGKSQELRYEYFIVDCTRTRTSNHQAKRLHIKNVSKNDIAERSDLDKVECAA